MAWVYGADKFLEDLRYMLGFYPYPYYFWYWAWKLVAPGIVLVSSSHSVNTRPFLNILSTEHPAVHGS